MASEPEKLQREGTCRDCNATFAFEVIMLSGIEFPKRSVCDECGKKHEIEFAAKEKAKLDAENEAEWRKICPPLYSDTNPADPRLSQEGLAKALQWAYNPRGLGFVGHTGKGKTRCLFLALKKAFDDDHSVDFVSHNLFSRFAMDAWSSDDKDERANAREALRSFKSVGILLMDDLGKAPPSPRADSELEELIEHRAGMNLPLFWTANASGAWLIKRFGEDRGEPLVRRLAEFTEIVKV